MNLAGPWRPGTPAEIVKPPRFYADLADALLNAWMEKFKAGDTEPWCLTVEVNPPIDLGCSGLRKELRDKLADRDEEGFPVLTLRRRWLTPSARGDAYNWKRRKQPVEFTLVERDFNDPRVESLLDRANDIKKERDLNLEKIYDFHQKRRKWGRRQHPFGMTSPLISPLATPKEDLGHASSLIPEMAAKLRFLEGEKLAGFRKRMGIDWETVAVWLEASGYPVGPDVTAEQEAEWRAAWFESGKAKVWAGQVAEARQRKNDEEEQFRQKLRQR